MFLSGKVYCACLIFKPIFIRREGMFLPLPRNYDEEVIACLSLVAENGLSCRQYTNIRHWNDSLFHLKLPPWDVLMSQAKVMVPAMTITESGEISYDMQATVNNDVKR